MTIPEKKPVKGWWFGGDTLPNGDGRSVTEGCVLRVEPPIVMCDRGLHFSPRVLNALEYARCATVWRVEGWGESASDATKLACEYRRHLWCLDIGTELRRFTRREALRVLPDNAPDCVREYLMLADADKASETQRLAARFAAWNAAVSVAEYAVRDAALDEAWSAAWYAVGYAALDEPWSAAWYGSRSVARSVAWSAAEYAAVPVTWSATRLLSWSAAVSAVRNQQTRSLESMVWAAIRAALAAMGEDGR